MSIDSPSTNDILFGRDSDSWNHEGNRRFRIVVANYQDEYHATTARTKKVEIVAKIVEELRGSGARFLKRDSKTKKWFEVDRKASIEKVGHAIRDKQVIAQRKLQKLKEESSESFGNDVRSRLLAAASARNHLQHLNDSLLLQQHTSFAQRRPLSLASMQPRVHVPRSSILPELLLAQSLADQTAESDLDQLVAARALQLQQERQRQQAIRSVQEVAVAEALLSQHHAAQTAGGVLAQRAAAVREMVAARERRELISAIIAEDQHRGLDALRTGGLLAQSVPTLRNRSSFAAMPTSTASALLLAGGAAAAGGSSTSRPVRPVSEPTTTINPDNSSDEETRKKSPRSSSVPPRLT